MIQVQYRHEGKEYHVATCMSCSAALTVTTSQLRKESGLRYYDENIPCCKHPNFFGEY